MPLKPDSSEFVSKIAYVKKLDFNNWYVGGSFD